MSDPAGLISYQGRVGPQDIDENGHMNVRIYDAVFEAASMAFYKAMGWTEDYPRLARMGFFRVEKHLRYERELALGAATRITTYLAYTDLRSFHTFMQLWNEDTGERAATMEALSLHVDLDTRRSTELTDPALADGWLTLAREHQGLEQPKGMGRSVAPRHKNTR